MWSQNIRIWSQFWSSLAIISFVAWLSHLSVFWSIHPQNKVIRQDVSKITLPAWTFYESMKNIFTVIYKIFLPRCSLLSNTHLAVNMKLLKEGSSKLALFLPPSILILPCCHYKELNATWWLRFDYWTGRSAEKETMSNLLCMSPRTVVPHPMCAALLVCLTDCLSAWLCWICVVTCWRWIAQVGR